MNKITIAILFFIFGIFVNWIWHDYSPHATFKVIRDESKSYKLTNPFLLLEVPEEESFPLYRPLKTSLEDYVNQATREKKAEVISVYFRDLDRSRWIAVNETERFSPASMLKVVVLISTLHVSQNNPSILTSKIYIKPSENDNNDIQNYYPSEPVTSGRTYTVRDLLTSLIIESDNNANSVLTQFIGKEQIRQTFDVLKLPMPEDPTAPYVDTAAEYSHVFRVLYNGTYLSNSLSEQALDLLTKSKFHDGLVAGVPEKTLVAHKFGERSFYNNDPKNPSSRELHDCGIIYYPEAPYLLCVMTRGSDFPTLANIIKDLSAITWKNVDQIRH